MKTERRGIFQIKSELADEIKVVARNLEEAIKIFRHLNGTAYYIFKVEYICSVEVGLGND